EEAVALGQVHDGTLDLLIAGASQADAIAVKLHDTQPQVAVLRVVEAPESSPNEIRFPFTQVALLDRVAALLAPKQESASGSHHVSSDDPNGADSVQPTSASELLDVN